MEAVEDEEDEEGFKLIATMLVKSASAINRKLNKWSMTTRILFTRLFCPDKCSSFKLKVKSDTYLFLMPVCIFLNVRCSANNCRR